MNLSRLSNKNLFGKILRLPLRLLPEDMVIPIMQTKMKGKLWIAGSGVHGYWLGCYEYALRKFFETKVRAGTVVFDIGAHTGFYTILSSVLVGQRGQVFAFEPLPRNLSYLHKHLKINNILNARVVESAVSNYNGTASFDAPSDSSVGRLVDGSCGLSVSVVSIDGLVSSQKLPVPDYMKIDVEGEEFSVLLGSEKTLKTRHPGLFISLHTQEARKKCIEFLVSIDYRIQEIIPNEIYAYT
ncbi:MAG: FkbM family methyltransferase [Candidatus Omnitrophica bacterium]|nr:FkbM family methyltransferase [Candidatus Omnitrophota bacterium]